jgi:hypothetical protein
LRLTATLALAAACALVGATAAGADQPVKTAVDNQQFSGEFCAGATITVTPTASKEFVKEFSNGSAVITGTFKAVLTNDKTGASVTVNASGPGFFPADGNSAVLRGLTLLLFTQGTFGSGSPPTLLLTSGTTTVTDEGFTTTGATRDLCAEIAG